MGSIRKRLSKTGEITFCAQIRLKGYKQLTATFQRKTDASEWIKATEAEMKAGRYLSVSEAKKYTLDDLILKFKRDEYQRRKDITNCDIHLNFWSKKLGHHSLKEVNLIRIKEVWLDLCNNHISPSTGKRFSNRTLNYYLQTLSVLFNHAIRELQWIQINPVANIKKLPLKNGRVRYLNEDELRRFISAVEKSTNPKLLVAILLSLQSGGRKTEILSLRWKNIDLEKGIIHFKRTKNGDSRSVTIHGRALDCLREHSKIRSLHNDYVFPARANGWKNGQGKTSTPWQNLKAPFLRALELAEIKDFRWHDMRHTAASYLYNSGASFELIGKILGHRTTHMTLRYSHLFENKSAELTYNLSKLYDSITIAN